MSLLATIVAKTKCAICAEPVAPEDLVSSSLTNERYHFACMLNAPQRSPATEPLWRHHGTPKRITPPKRLYCLKHCFTMRDVAFDEMRGFVCTGCNTLLWCPWGATPAPDPSPYATCRIPFHIGHVRTVRGERVPVCLSCAGAWPEVRLCEETEECEV